MRSVLIDTAGPTVGLAAFVAGRVAWTGEARVVAGAEEWLDDALSQALAALGGVDRVAVSVGPGAFTGLRVSVATALGLAVSTGAQVVPLSSLAVRACLAPGEPRVLALLDARKGRVYAGWFDTRGPVPFALGPEQDVVPSEAVRSEPGVAVGEGALVARAFVLAAGHREIEGSGRSPVAEAVALVERGEGVAAQEVGLRYLREPDARPPPR